MGGEGVEGRERTRTRGEGLGGCPFVHPTSRWCMGPSADSAGAARAAEVGATDVATLSISIGSAARVAGRDCGEAGGGGQVGRVTGGDC